MVTIGLAILPLGSSVSGSSAATGSRASVDTDDGSRHSMSWIFTRNHSWNETGEQESAPMSSVTALTYRFTG